jgi:hypothetical protein
VVRARAGRGGSAVDDRRADGRRADGRHATVAAPTVAAPTVADTRRNVLVIYSHGRVLPGNVNADVERGLAAGFAQRPDIQVDLSFELLERARFSGPEYERVVVTYLRDKYAMEPPELVMVSNDRALELVTRHRADLFPKVPIVHMGVPAAYLKTIPPLPPDVLGTPITHDFLGTIEQARRWHRGARRLVVITGSTWWDREWEARLRGEVGRLPPGLDVEFLAGLSIDELRRRLRDVPADSIVFTPGFFQDGAGASASPRTAARLIADAAQSAPVYGPFASFVGTGAVGGRSVDYEMVGRIGAATAAALLAGQPPSSVEVPATVPTPLQVDWRQLQRWHIPDGAVPADAIVRFREPSLWEAHRDLVLLGCAVMLIQAGLIIALLFERRRRQRIVTALARNEEHMRLAATAAGLSTWVLEEGEAGAGARAPARQGEGGYAVVDFRETLARIAPRDRGAVDAALNEARGAGGEFEVEYRVAAQDGAWEWQLARGRADRAARRGCSASRSTPRSASAPSSRRSRTGPRCIT